jgi:hypothetical protein
MILSPGSSGIVAGALSGFGATTERGSTGRAVTEGRTGAADAVGAAGATGSGEGGAGGAAAGAETGSGSGSVSGARRTTAASVETAEGRPSEAPQVTQKRYPGGFEERQLEQVVIESAPNETVN